ADHGRAAHAAGVELALAEPVAEPGRAAGGLVLEGALVVRIAARRDVAADAVVAPALLGGGARLAEARARQVAADAVDAGAVQGLLGLGAHGAVDLLRDAGRAVAVRACRAHRVGRAHRRAGAAHARGRRAARRGGHGARAGAVARPHVVERDPVALA